MSPRKEQNLIYSQIKECMNRIYTLEENDFVNEMHYFDVDKILTEEFYKIFKLSNFSFNHTYTFRKKKFVLTFSHYSNF